MRAHYETLSKEELIDNLLHYKGKFEREKLESQWLDEMVNHLRDDDDEPEYPEQEIQENRERFNKHITSENWKL